MLKDKIKLPKFLTWAAVCISIVAILEVAIYKLANRLDHIVDDRAMIRATSLAQEISAKHTHEQVEILAYKYINSMFSQEIIFPDSADKLIGNVNSRYNDNYVERYMVVESTAYWTHDPIEASGNGIAYDGTEAIPYKTIAVDPRVIPLQADVFIPKIGWCRANDTGNAISGKIVDIAMPSRTDAWNWGRRLIYVKIRISKDKK